MKAKTILGLLVFVTVGFSAVGQNKVETVEIETSAVCKNCKKRIENALMYTKGVLDAELNLETKMVKVVYKTTKTDLEKVKMAVAKAGYRADDVEADEEAYNALPKCCQEGSGAPHIEE